MTELEIDFFEEYRRVDNICKDMYLSGQGVTEYISQMERYDIYGSSIIKNWNEKYKELKHLRWLRNQIAHESFSGDLEQTDLIELQRFHKQLLNQKDPLAELAKRQRECDGRSRYEEDFFVYLEHENNAGESDYSLLMLVAILIIAVVSYIFIFKI